MNGNYFFIVYYIHERYAMSVTQLGFIVTAPTTLTAVAGTASGSLDASAAYGYKVTYVTGFGETNPSSNTAVTTTSTGSVNLSAIPVSSNGNVSARNIYRTVGGGSSWLLLTTLSDNTTTTYLDIIADGSLGAAAPTRNSAGSRQSFTGECQIATPTILSFQTGITAGVGGTSVAATQLTKEISLISTVTTANDSVKLPELATALIGMKVVVKNLAANTARIYPFDGQQIESAGADVPTTIATTVIKAYVAQTATNWVQIQ